MGAGVAILPMATEHLPAVLDIWAAQRAAEASEAGRAGWSRPLPERRALVAGRLRSALAQRDEQSLALVATRDSEVVAYLIGREVRLPRGSTYLTYVPEHFLNVGADDWGAFTPAAVPLLADLYAEIGRWIVARGGDTHLIAVAPGDARAALWSDLGFAPHDAYAYLPCAAVRASTGGGAVRTAAPDDLAIVAELIAAEAAHHHTAPIFAYAPPGLAEAKRRELAENLTDPGASILLATVNGAIVGALSAYQIAEPPSWAATALPTPCRYIDSAYVRPEARGRGVLRALVAALAAVVPPDTAGLFVTYLPANLGAAAAWTALGFRPFASIEQRRLDPRAVRQYGGMVGEAR